jgi:chromosome segregation ATPase
LCFSTIEINHLNEEIQSLLSTHQNEVSVLQQAIFEKQTAINETESNLTVIGTYVDKLEERLATFAITRRDIDVREQRCKEIEERVVQAESERDEMKQKAEEFAVEHEDLKKLLDELVQERTTLRHEKEALIAERDKLLAGENALREAVTSLEQDVEELDGVAQEWRSKVVQLELELGEEAMKARTAEERYEHLLSEFEALQESRNEQPKEEVLELDSSEDEEERFSGPEESATIWLPQGKQKTEPSDRENVPLRSLRKFFSQKTGLHGVFTPSSRQLVPPPPRVPPTSSGMPKQMPPRPPNLPPPA